MLSLLSLLPNAVPSLAKSMYHCLPGPVSTGLSCNLRVIHSQHSLVVDVRSRHLVEEFYPLNGRKLYGTGITPERHHDGGSPPSDRA